MLPQLAVEPMDFHCVNVLSDRYGPVGALKVNPRSVRQLYRMGVIHKANKTCASVKMHPEFRSLLLKEFGLN
jgi:hypothetical protein